MQLVLSPEGKQPSPEQLARIPSTLMSDALVELMEPYIYWPPAPDELEELESWLQLGADVWNVTVEAKNGASCVRGLAELAADVDDEDPIGLVQEIAQRKLARFGSDQRRVAAVRVVSKGKMATVEATTIAYVR